MCGPVAPWSLKALQLLATSVTLLSMSEAPATPVTPCPECLRLRAAVDQARKQIAELQAKLHELRCQLNRNSSNSSSPPSVDPPGAPKPVVKTPSGRKPGGQPGHPGKGLARHPGPGQRKEADPPAQWRRISSALAGDPWLPAIPAAA